MKVLIAGGGTGGHVFPALSIAEAIRQLSPDGEIAFAGRKSGMEAELLPGKGYRYHGVSTGQIRGMGLTVFSSLFQMVRGVFESLEVIRAFGPDIVLGVGGYVSFPVGMAALILRKNLLLHEQNSVPGSSNRLLGKFASRVFTGFGGTADYFNGRKVLFTGNPLRQELVSRALTRKEDMSKPFNLLVLGGSGGASRVNSFALELVRKINERNLPFRVYHQTGERDYERMLESYRGQGDKVVCFPFAEKIEDYYEKAAFAVTRGGALTISEISCFCIPAVIIPYPYAADGHQEKNALEFESSGCGLMMREEDLDADRVLGFFLDLAGDERKYREAMINSRKFARPFASDEIARECLGMEREGPIV